MPHTIKNNIDIVHKGIHALTNYWTSQWAIKPVYISTYKSDIKLESVLLKSQTGFGIWYQTEI